MKAIYLILLLFLVYKIARLIFNLSWKEEGWSEMEEEIKVLAHNTYFHKEWIEANLVLSQLAPEEHFVRKSILLTLAIEILITFNPEHQCLKIELMKIKYLDMGKFEMDVKKHIECTIPDQYCKN